MEHIKEKESLSCDHGQPTTGSHRTALPEIRNTYFPLTYSVQYDLHSTYVGTILRNKAL